MGPIVSASRMSRVVSVTLTVSARRRTGDEYLEEVVGVIRFCEPLLAPHELVAVKLNLRSRSDPTEDIVYFADRAARADVLGRIERARVRRADSPLRGRTDRELSLRGSAEPA